MPSDRESFCSLDEIIVPPQDASDLPPRVGQLNEREAFFHLSNALAHARSTALQRLVEVAADATGAGSAGLSVEESDREGVFLRWVATTGEFSRYVNGTMPREFSPCGTAMDHRRPLVMRDPVRYYAYISQLHAPVRSVLLVPFSRGGRPIGTVWVAEHTPQKNFTVHDLRLVESLTVFAAALLDAAHEPFTASESG